jgi:hypothetical protein
MFWLFVRSAWASYFMDEVGEYPTAADRYKYEYISGKALSLVLGLHEDEQQVLTLRDHLIQYILLMMRLCKRLYCVV